MSNPSYEITSHSSDSSRILNYKHIFLLPCFTLFLSTASPQNTTPIKQASNNPYYMAFTEGTCDTLKFYNPFLEEFISSFYEDLLSNQQPLDNDMKKVLYDNLWELYES